MDFLILKYLLWATLISLLDEKAIAQKPRVR